MAGMGPTLASLGQSQMADATEGLAKVADEEAKRNANNTMLEAQEKQGKRSLGASAGAMVGMSFGPVGALIGGAIGYVAGGLFD